MKIILKIHQFIEDTERLQMKIAILGIFYFVVRVGASIMEKIIN